MKKIILMIFMLTFASNVYAGGPFYTKFTNDGTPLKWKDGKVRWVSETGDLSAKINNKTVVNWIADLFLDWQNACIYPSVLSDNKICPVSLDIKREGSVNVDISASNYKNYLVESEKGVTPIIFDYDGAIIDDFLGVGMSDYVIGFAAPRTADVSGGVIYNAQIVMNGKFVDGIEDNQAGEDLAGDDKIDMFKAAIFHELGHLLNMDHTQLNVDIAEDIISGLENTEIKAGGALASYSQHVPTMYPLLVTDGQLEPHRDDIITLASMYPSTSFDNNFCKIKGVVYTGPSTFGFPGVNVLASNAGTSSGLSRIDAHSAVTGNHYELVELDGDVLYDGSEKFGEYTIYGLLPGEKYKVTYEEINKKFTGGSSLEPFGYINAVPPSGFGTGQILTKNAEETALCETGGTTIEMEPVSLSIKYVPEDMGAVLTNATPIETDNKGTTKAAGGGCSLIR